VRSKSNPADSLNDIIDNAARVERYLAGMDRESFDANEMLRDAVERCLERICEAAHRLGEQAAELMPGHPWGAIRGMGNQLRHAYHRINADILWNAVRLDVPALAADSRLALVRLSADEDRSADRA
jgi:uncharacterized protein with HEPN domain